MSIQYLNCEIDHCENGDCFDGVNAYICKCFPGFEGTNYVKSILTNAVSIQEETHAGSMGFVKTKRMITPAHVRKDIQARIVRSMWTSAGQLMVQALAGMGKPVEMILDTTRANVFLDTMVPLSV